MQPVSQLLNGVLGGPTSQRHGEIEPSGPSSVSPPPGSPSPAREWVLACPLPEARSAGQHPATPRLLFLLGLLGFNHHHPVSVASGSLQSPPRAPRDGRLPAAPEAEGAQLKGLSSEGARVSRGAACWAHHTRGLWGSWSCMGPWQVQLAPRGAWASLTGLGKQASPR